MRGCGRAGAPLVEHVETIWREPDDGIWEARGPRRHYTHSKVMAWVVLDRAVRLAEQFALDAPIDRWKETRDEIHREVCERATTRDRKTFTQYYGSKELDASVLMFRWSASCPATDERITGTIDADRAELGRDGFVSRYSTAETDDGLPVTRGSSWPARSGSSARWPSTVAPGKRGSSSNASSA